MSTENNPIEDLEPVAAHAEAVRGGNAVEVGRKTKKEKTEPEPSNPVGSDGGK